MVSFISKIIPCNLILTIASTQGQAWLNGHNLGRYWPAVGPQKTLFVPSKYLETLPNNNTLLLFEIDESPCKSPASCFVDLTDKQNIG